MTTTVLSQPIFKTKDYSIFKKLGGNRDLYQTQVYRLVNVIDRDPEFTRNNPLKVNEKMQIIDGQHRLAAFERYLDKNGVAHPVYYVVTEGLRLSDARSMNAGSKPWLPKDYAAAFAEEGSEDYKTYLEFAEKYPLNHNITMRFLGNISKSVRRLDFRGGDFKVVDAERATQMLDQLMELSAYFKDATNQAFGLAFWKVGNSPAYKHVRMVEQISKYHDGLAGVPMREKEIVPALNMIYNWSREDKVDLMK